MFAHPKKWNAHLIANVTLTDGRTIPWEFPRMEKLGYLERAQKERYRKWTHEYVNEPEYSYVLPETCAFIARQIHDGNASPRSIELVRYWTWIQPPPGFGARLPEGEHQYSFFKYNVKAEDLK